MERRPKAKSAADAEFLALGEGVNMWLSEAAASGSTKMRVKMGQVLALAKLFDPGEVDWALGDAVVHGRFAEADLASILDHHAGIRPRERHSEHRAGEDHSLAQGTSAWAELGQPRAPQDDGADLEGDVEDHATSAGSARGASTARGRRGAPTSAAAAAPPSPCTRGRRDCEGPTLETG